MFKRKPLKLIEIYQHQIESGDIRPNAQQELILKTLEDCYLQSKPRYLPWKKAVSEKKNVYIYGTVGSGKTFVMDLFFDAIPGDKKARFHFHQFLENIAKNLKGYQGQKDPMKKIVKDLCASYELICLDEMMVEDVVQAMLLLELIPALMEADIMLVFTSNIEPSKLYMNGLQRKRFMKVIDYIISYAFVIPLASNLDYRSNRLPLPKTTYFFPNSQENTQSFRETFLQYANHFQGPVDWSPLVLIQNRQVQAVARAKELVWFEFASIAQIPRCQRDYLELAAEYKLVFISQVPVFEESSSSVILWMYMIDVFYDAQIKLLVCADVELSKLYPKGPYSEPFKRTISRMQEMQSQWYWDSL